MKKLSIISGLTLLFILAQNADAFSFSILPIGSVPIPSDVTMMLLGAGVVGLIGLCRRRLKK